MNERPSSSGCPATSTTVNSSEPRSTGITPSTWRPIIAAAKEGAASAETLRLRVGASG
ncbi:hypothetical protein N4G66_22100 [Streptomyces rhizosphaerihabitans]|nr:hypothetical protein [Streptomyces rhizosphaerihabitans]MCT9007525.1 hypothetical protein [Streptomyces rhizosphaerihabitans]